MAKNTKKSNLSSLGGFLTDVTTGVLDVLKDTTGGVSNAIKRMTGKTITAEQVIDVLEKIRIGQSQYTTEKNIENVISKFLDPYFLVHRQYNIGGFLGLKIDIDLNETIGIELKLAKELTTTNIERLLGQIIYYNKRRYSGDKLIVAIVGTAKEANSRIIEELEEIIADDLDIYFRFIVVNPRK
jgi:hypothetical protein